MIFVVVSTGHFDPLIRQCARLNQKFEFRAQIGSGTYLPPFPYFRTADPTEIEECMSVSELVITHAGTGMLSMLYRLQKPSIVIPKQKRYGEANDGQVELAVKWGELGMSELCMDLDRLGDAIVRSREREFVFPRFPRLGVRLQGEVSPLDSSTPFVNAPLVSPKKTS